MSPNTDVVFYLKEQQLIEELNGKRFQIARTKNEEVFYPLSNSDSLAYKFVEKVSQYDVLRTLFFLKPIKVFTFNIDYPVQIVYPFFPSSQKELIDEIKTGKILSKKVETLKKNAKGIEDEITRLSYSIFSTFTSVIFSDRRVLNAIRRKKKEDLVEILRNVFEKNREKLETRIRDIQEMITKLRIMMELRGLLNAIDNVTLAEENFGKLRFAIDLPNEINDLQSAISEIATLHPIVKVSVDVMCLDCYLRREKPPYTKSVRNVLGKIELERHCPNCGGEALLYMLSIEFKKNLHRLVITNRLQEAIIGMTLANIDKFSKVYVGKKIQAILHGEYRKSLEADVIAISQDKRLLIAEVTTSSSLDHVVKKATSKAKTFHNYNIEYDAYVYISPAIVDSFIRLEKGSNYIFTAKHIPKLNYYIEQYVLKEITKS